MTDIILKFANKLNPPCWGWMDELTRNNPASSDCVADDNNPVGHTDLEAWHNNPKDIA